MDRLPLERQELLRKSSTERLRVKLMQEGFDEDKVMAMERPELLEAMTTAMLSAVMRACLLALIIAVLLS